MFFLCSKIVEDPRHVEDVRGGGGGAGLDFAVRRNDRGLGAADSPILRSGGADALRKEGTASGNGALPVDSAGLRHQHCQGESASKAAFAPSRLITAKGP